jgi:hypothetical protein
MDDDCISGQGIGLVRAACSGVGVADLTCKFVKLASFLCRESFDSTAALRSVLW